MDQCCLVVWVSLANVHNCHEDLSKAFLLGCACLVSILDKVCLFTDISFYLSLGCFEGFAVWFLPCAGRQAAGG